MKKHIIHILFLLGLVLAALTSKAQVPEYYANAINIDSIIANDPNPVLFMKQVYVTPDVTDKMTNKQRRRHSRLVRNFKKAYPYAKLMGSTMQDIENNLKYIPNEKDQKKYIKKREKEFRAQYEDDIKKLTISQGLLLIKLIDRETGSTSFEIIKEFKGGVLAGTFQALARIFGHNLKVNYDPEGEDKDIEMLVLKYENGQL